MVRGWISHEDPLTFDPKNAQFETNGLALFLCQVLIILCLCFLLGNIFQRIGEPKVLGELLAGVVLGPTAFGNIPGFDSTIVPTQSLVLLKLTSNIGLVFFILLVGLETDTNLIRRYARQVALIALPGMAVPFAISVGLAEFVYDELGDHTKSFTTFFLFVSTVMAVTSLSVLSRVVSELKLLNTVLGSVTIAAGALNDLIGYILLALGSALGGGGKQINALYQLLVALALFVFQWFAVRPVMFYLIRRSGFDMTPGAKGRVPHHLLVMTLLGALVSAFVTDACNLHPILGALLFGIACPHDNFAVMVTEGIETISVGILLPLYFVTSGLNADFKLLNSGIVWGQIVLIFVVVFISKFVATAVCTRLAGFSWREGAFVASLMQSKSIIELIILNAGQEIGVLSPRVYSMLFVTFILSTLTVRPLASWLYSQIDAPDHEGSEKTMDPHVPLEKKTRRNVQTEQDTHDRSLLDRTPVCLVAAMPPDNLAVETLMVLMRMIGQGARSEDAANAIAPIQMSLMQLVPNDGSTSNILRMLQSGKDKQLDILRHVGHMHRVQFLSANVVQMSTGRQDSIVVNNANDVLSAIKQRLQLIDRRVSSAHSTASIDEDLGCAVVVVPWSSNAHLAPVPAEAPSSRLLAKTSTLAAQLFHRLQGFSVGVLVDSAYTSREPSPLWNRLKSDQHVLAQMQTLGLTSVPNRKARIVVPFFGGSDDRCCVEMAKQIASNGLVDALIIGVSQVQLPQDVVHELENALGQTNDDESAGVGDESHGGINLMTLNVTAANMTQNDRRNARDLFATGLPAHEEDQAESGAAVAPGANDDSGDQTIDRSGNVTYVTLRESYIARTETKTHVEAIMTYMAPLLDARMGDIVLAGRGKLQQRTSDFRLQVEAVQRIMQDRVSKEGNLRRRPSQDAWESIADDDVAAKHARSAEIASIGRVLGACCEAILVGQISANILVLQSKTAQSG